MGQQDCISFIKPHIASTSSLLEKRREISYQTVKGTVCIYVLLVDRRVGRASIKILKRLNKHSRFRRRRDLVIY
jgi:hypothetical protein